MKNFVRIAILSTAAIATVLGSVDASQARKRYPLRHHVAAHHHLNNRAVIAGTAGLAAGLIVGSAIAAHRPHYVGGRTIYVAPAPVYVGRTTYVAPAYVPPADYYDGPSDDIYDGQDYGDQQGYEPRQNDAYQNDDGDQKDNGYGQDDQAYGNEDQYQGDDQTSGRDYFPQAPRHQGIDDRDNGQQAGGLEPWSREWRSFCEGRYRTFNAKTGTYHGIDGQDHFCSAS